MSNGEPKKRLGITLLAEDVRQSTRTLYLYRTNAKREPLGRHILKTTQPLELETIRSQFGPGVFYVMETGGKNELGDPLPLTTDTLLIEADATEKQTETPMVGEHSSFFREMQELYKLKVLERESRAEPSLLEIIKAVRELSNRPATDGDTVLQAFLKGAEWGTPEGAPDPLTDAISKIVESKAGGDPQTQRLNMLLQQKLRILERKITDLETEKTALSVRVHNAEAVAIPAGESSTDLGAVIADALRSLAAGGARTLTQALVEISASAPDVVAELESLGAEERERILRDTLEPDFPELVYPYLDSLESYLDRLREARTPSIPPVPAIIPAPPVPPVAPPEKPPSKRKYGPGQKTP